MEAQRSLDLCVAVAAPHQALGDVGHGGDPVEVLRPLTNEVVAPAQLGVSSSKGSDNAPW